MALSRDTIAEARFASVLDGRTLNIEVPIPRLRHDDVYSAELRTVHRTQRRAIPARIRAEGDGRFSVEATVLLDGSRSGLALQPGARWLLEVAVQTRSGGEQIFKVVSGRQTSSDLGVTVSSPPHPDTGYLYRARLQPSGRLALSVAPPRAPIAELSRIQLDWLQTALEIRVVGRPHATPGAVEIVEHSGAGRMTVPVETVGIDRVRCELPMADLMAISTATQPVNLHMFVRCGRQRLRIGHYLHDLMDARQVLRPTPAIVWAAPGKCMRVEVRFAATGAMSLTCRPI